MTSATVDLQGVGFSFGPQVVLGEVTVVIGATSRLAVVGPNGVGKSTLLRLIAGDEAPEHGSIVRSPPSATLGYLPQERDRRPGERLLDYLARRTGVAAAEAALDAAATRLAEPAPPGAAADDYALALEHYLAIGGPDLAQRAPAVLDALGLHHDLLEQEMTALSGGELARSALAAVLLSQLELLLLDEPTNDLDDLGLAQLESFLTRRQGGLVVVSHDRAFMERVCTQVLEIDEFSRRGTLFGGGFATYLEERERARAAALESYESYDSARRALVDRARRERDWARQGQAHATSARALRAEPDKNVRAAKVAGAQARGAAAARTERALDRLEQVEDPREPWDLRLELSPSARGGVDVAGLAGAVVERGRFRLGPVDLRVRRGDRLLVRGSNGSGKSTLLAALLGRVQLASGQQWSGRSVVVGEIDQVRRTFDPAQPLGAAFRERTGQLEAESRTLLAKFGLGAGDVGRPVGSLSPGERTRADLALLMATQANLLVLDEPTNHLDLPAIEALEEALGGYDATLILVTHDRRLVERVETGRQIVVEAGRVRER